jgi:ATPase subunit of ABC transporter with duplicated ATPase domains
MPASIVLSRVALSTPDGRTLLSDIDLSFAPERTGLVGRNGVGKTTLMRLIAGELAPQSGTIAVGGTLGVVRQSVLIKPNETIADLFGVTDALALLRRAEAGEATADELADADWTIEDRIVAALARVDLDARPDTRLMELSGGQGTRARLAAAVFAQSDFLLLDEPTNNLDRAGRDTVIELLSRWRAGAVIVSHDRELLEHMDAIVELTSLGATRYSGNWSVYRARKAIELEAARRDLAHAEKTVSDARRKAQAAVERKDRRDAAGARKAARGDLPRILMGNRKSEAQASRGEGARMAERQQARALEAAAAARARVEVLQELSVVLPPTRPAASRVVLKIDGVTAGYDAARPIIRDLSFSMIGPERVAVVGPNGSGKTTLLRLIAGQMKPFHGMVSVAADFALLDQSVSILDAEISILDNFMRLNPASNENACRAALARFMFRTNVALTTVSGLSGGQVLRAGLACVLGGATPPQLLILDEPTNHLDIESIEAVEAGLRTFDGALLVVSHDDRFLEGIGITRRLEFASQSARFP